MKDPNTNHNIHFESEPSTGTSIDNSTSNALKTLLPENKFYCLLETLASVVLPRSFQMMIHVKIVPMYFLR